MNSDIPFYDVVQIGYGPVSEIMALALARQGRKVAVFERWSERFMLPRAVCIDHELYRVLSALGMSKQLPLVSHAGPQYRWFNAEWKQLLAIDWSAESISGGPEVNFVHQPTLEKMFEDVVQAYPNVDLNLGWEAIEATQTADYAQLVVRDVATGETRTVRSKYLIGADGANSLVRRRVATAFRRDQLSIATGFFAHGVSSDEIVIELTGDPPGYIWSFPRPGHLAIGICAQADAGIGAAALRTRTAAWIAATRIAGGATLEPYSWPIPSLSARDFGALELTGPRWALIGDAAGLVDPITREGIFFAIASGQWIADALIAGDPAPRYAARVRDEAISELMRAARLKAGFFRPAFTGLMMRALTESAAIREVMADLVAGRQSYTTLKWRLLKTFELGLAWRVLTTHITLPRPDAHAGAADADVDLAP